MLLDIADDAIVAGLRANDAVLPDVTVLPAPLREPSGAFVTLTVGGRLNGCIGSVDPAEPLATSVARHAWSAAFADPRLPSLTRAGYRDLEIEISILSPLEPIAATSRQDVIDRLRPGIDGLLIVAGDRRAVFLPTVWASLPSPDDFLDHLCVKAGLMPGTWPAGMRAFVFTTESIGRRTR